MKDKSGTVDFLQIIGAPPERVYRAFSDPVAKVRWEPPFGFIGKIHQWDFEEGGRYKMTFINFSTGKAHSFHGEFQEILPNKKIVVTDLFEDESLPGEMLTTVKFRKVINGTELHLKQIGIPEEIPLEFCYAGWQQSMIQLAQLVETEAPDEP